MNLLFEWMLANVLVASFLALVAFASRGLRKPALTHGLWVLVLLKLVTPPMFRIAAPSLTLPAPSEQDASATKGEGERRGVSPPVLVELAETESDDYPPDAVQTSIVLSGSGTGGLTPRRSPVLEEPIFSPAPVVIPWVEILFLSWAAGSFAWLILVAYRLSRFQRLLQNAELASTELRREAEILAERLQVRCPVIWLVPGALSPMLWAFGGKPRLLLPAHLLERLTPEQRDTLLIHELAHFRRRDHWVRWLEIAVLTPYWWCPLAWWARSELQQAEEECCDAWVVWACPPPPKSYPLALIEAVDFLADAPLVLPPAASGLGQVNFLKRRLTMILRGSTPRTLTVGGLLALLTLGVLLLPMMPTVAQPPKDDIPQELRERLEKAREEVEKTRAELLRRESELKAAMEKLRGDPKAPFPPAQAKPGEGRPSENRGPGGFGAGFPRPGAPFNGPFPGGTEKRLDELERKIDNLMHEIVAMRREMGHRAPPPPPPPHGKDGPPPPPRGDGPPPPRGEGARKPGDGPPPRPEGGRKPGENPTPRPQPRND